MTIGVRFGGEVALSELCSVRDLVPTSPESLDALACELRTAAAGFGQACGVLQGAAGLPVWVGPAASAFDEAAGGASGRYHGVATHLGIVAAAVAGYAAAVRVARDAAWWAIEGMEQASAMTRAWGQVPAPPPFPARDTWGRPPSAPPTPADPGEPVRARARARWAVARGELAVAGAAARVVLQREAGFVELEKRAGWATRFTAGLGGSLLTMGEGVAHQAQGVLPWKTWDVVSGDAEGLYTLARHPGGLGEGGPALGPVEVRPGRRGGGDGRGPAVAGAAERGG